MGKRAFRLCLPNRSEKPAGRAVRAGGVTLELILCLPVWLIILAAAIEFGTLIAGLQQLALATRVGALEASETVDLGDLTVFPDQVADLIDHQLQTAGIKYCRLIIQHNVPKTGGGTNPPLEQPHPTDPCDCDPPTTAAYPEPLCGDYVQVTVCVKMTDMTPNLLSIFGYDISDEIVRHTTTYRYETTPTGIPCTCP